MSSVKLISLVLLPVLSVTVLGQQDVHISDLIKSVQMHVDRPLKKDLEKYIESLDHVVSFFDKNKEAVDMNVKFGLFLSNVNLKKCVNTTIPKNIYYALLPIIYKLDHLMRYFKIMVERDQDAADFRSKKMLPLFDNETHWVSKMKTFDKFHLRLPEAKTYEELQEIYSDWKTYTDTLGKNLELGERQSDFCFECLSDSTVVNVSSEPRCFVPQSCIDMVKNGTNYGYPLTHRILLLLLARYGRGCSIFSSKEDQLLVHQLCKMSYMEAEYIALNKNKQIDLMMEQILACALNEQSEFLRRSWLNVVLGYQTINGCFSFDKNHRPLLRSVTPVKQNWQLERKDFDLLNCNTHVSTVAAGAISFGIRYILEVYY